MVFGIGESGLKIHIEIHPNPQSLASRQVVPLEHLPSWRVGKNPFASALSRKTNALINNHNNPAAAVAPAPLPVPNAMPQQAGQYNMQPPPMPPQPFQQPQPPMMQMGMNMNMYDKQQEEIWYAYGANEDVQGVVHLTLPPGKRFEHLGVKIQFLGRINVSHAIYDGRPHYDFISLTKELQPPSTLYQTQTSIPFHFRTDEKPYETYHGRNASIRYFVRVLVSRKFFPQIKQDKEMIVQLIKHEPRLNQAIKMEVGIEECLHIEFQYKKRYYHLDDVIEGDIHFMLVRIKIKYMELAVIRRETSGEGLASSNGGGVGGTANANEGSVVTETQTLTRFEIMDGAPVKGEIIPVRLYLGGIPADLTPTHDSSNNRFSVRYYLNLVLVDEEDRRYFKQQEIILWRKTLG